MALKLHTQSTFSKHIEKTVAENNITYMDAICEFVEIHQMDIEKVGRLLSQNIKDKLYAEAIRLNMFKGKKINPLPFLMDED